MLRLVIGDKQLSSWSMRAWFLLRQLALPFEEIALRARHAGLCGRDRTPFAGRARAGADRRCVSRLGLARDRRVRQRAGWRSRLARDTGGTRTGTVSERRDAFRIRGAARPVAVRRRLHWVHEHARRRGPGGPAPDRIDLVGVPRTAARRRSVAVRSLLDRRRDVCARYVALPDLRRATRGARPAVCVDWSRTIRTCATGFAAQSASWPPRGQDR